MKSFSFVHAGDLHLDSPFRGITAQSPEVSGRLRSATFEAFDSLVRLCLERQVQFLLIAGDVYDGADRSVRAQLAFRDGLRTLAAEGIRSFLVYGNHDPLSGWTTALEWPEGVTVFGAEQPRTEVLSLDGEPLASICGMSYGRKREERNLARLYRSEHPGLFQIALLHGNCGGDPLHEAYAPCRLEDLTGAGFDYWALGHVHDRAVLHADPLVVYPGNTQGLNIRETGPRGCYLVNVDGSGAANPEFHPLDVVRWFSGSVGIEGLHTVDALDEKIGSALREFREGAGARPLVGRLSLTGRGPLYRDLRREGAVTDLVERAREAGLGEDPFIWLQDIPSECLPEVDLDARSEVNDFLGELLRLSRRIEEDMTAEGTDTKVPQEVLTALEDLFSHPGASRHLEAITPDESHRILREARLLCLDLLESGG